MYPCHFILVAISHDFAWPFPQTHRIGICRFYSIPFVAVFPQEFPHDIPDKMPPARPFPAVK